MTRDQTKYLKTRLAEARKRKREWSAPKFPMPIAVRTAKRIAAAWNRKRDRAAEKHREKIKYAVNTVEEAIMLGDFVKAIATLLRFEKSKP